jgi:hypothetical protein
MGAAAKKGTFDIVHRLNLEGDLLRRISEALGIPEAERGRIVSGEIVVSGPPTTQTTPGGSGTQTPAGGSSQTTPGGGSAQTTPGGGGSQTTPGRGG